ncbi:hypothetical protein GCM10025781_05690 [Kocuria gwangalliensis]|uniref:Uncharacterized protein n=1 Tax=Kocuria gwangalliensis TaxID=501592 RepID=A0ABP8WNQ1_9MICC
MRHSGPFPDNDAPLGKSYKLNLSQDDVPFPSLLKDALILIGLEAYGSSEKMALAA